MPKVVFSIEADGKDITDKIAPLLLEMTITDGEGFNGDTLSIVIDDVDGSIEPPRTGVILRAVGGYDGRERDFGAFSVDSVSYSGWPQVISISAQSVAAKELAKQREPKSYPAKDFPTYGDVFADVAASAGLPLSMSAELSRLPNPYEARTEENALDFLTRVGVKIDASVTVKSGRIVVVKKGSGLGAGGSALARIPVTRPGNLISYDVNEKDRPRYGTVEATVYDRAENVRATVSSETGLDGPKFLIREPFQTEEEAKTAAEAKGRQLARAQADASFTIDGEPFAQAESFADVSGVRVRVDGAWKVKTVTQNFSGSGAYTTTLACEVPSP